MIRFENENGLVGLGRPVFARITAEQVMRFADRMVLTTPKGKPIKVGLTGKESLKYIEVTECESEDAVDLKLYIMVKFGISIKAVTKELAEAVRAETLRVAGVSVREITVFVTAVKSKRIAKREMEVRC